MRSPVKSGVKNSRQYSAQQSNKRAKVKSSKKSKKRVRTKGESKSPKVARVKLIDLTVPEEKEPVPKFARGRLLFHNRKQRKLSLWDGLDQKQ